MRARFLRQDERAFAKRVFGKAIPLDDVLVTDLLGAGNESYTAVSSPETDSMPFVVPMPRYIFAINLGAQGFASCIAPNVRAAFVRELARVWQGPESIARQRNCGPVPYEVGRPWLAYNDDQKASLVADWVEGGMRADDPRMAYIQTNVRRGKRAQ
jgi:hypothetical protein